MNNLSNQIENYSIDQLKQLRTDIDNLIESKKIDIRNITQKDIEAIKKEQLKAIFQALLVGEFPNFDSIVESSNLKKEQAREANDWLRDRYQSFETQVNNFLNGIEEDEKQKFELATGDFNERKRDLYAYLNSNFNAAEYLNKSRSELKNNFGEWDADKGEVIITKEYLEHPYARIGALIVFYGQPYLK